MTGDLPWSIIVTYLMAIKKVDGSPLAYSIE